MNSKVDLKSDLTVFLLQQNHPNSDIDKATANIKDVVNKIVIVEQHHEIKNHTIDTEWYGILYDNEEFQEDLLTALPVFMEFDYDYLVIYKRKIANNQMRVWIAPRFFRKHIVLRDDCMLPKKRVSSQRFKSEKMLDGWVTENEDIVQNANHAI